MNKGDNEQLSHNKAAALRARLAAIADGDVSFQQYHQTGVVLSALADSAWWIGGKQWQEHAARLLGRAKDMFDNARIYLPHNDDVARAGLYADVAMWAVRMWRFDEHNDEYCHQADQNLGTAYGLLHGWTQVGPSLLPAAWHQMCIVYALMSQVAWGKPLGYAYVANTTGALHGEDEAMIAFSRERDITPDGERAYRSFLLTSALAHGMHGNAEQQRNRAKLALKSARQHGDRAHMVRAAAILAAGRHGERWLRIMQDGKAVRMAL